MSRKIKLVPVDMDTFNYWKSYYPQKEPIEILAPTSFELNSTKQGSSGVGVLGNTLVGESFFKERTYNFNWTGSKQEIDKIRFYIHQLSDEYFMFGGLTDNPIITPTVMYNSKAMLASLIDQYKPVNSRYETMLPRNWFNRVPRKSTYGVRLASYSSSLENQFGILPTDTRGASAFAYLEKGKSYSWIYDPNYINQVGENPHNTPIEMMVVSLADNGNGGVIHQTTDYATVANRIFTIVENLTHDAILRITVTRPTPDITSYYNNPQLFGVLNYSVPLVTTSHIVGSQDRLEQASLESFDEVPSLLSLDNDGVYNILSPNLAEFSCTFREVVNVVS